MKAITYSILFAFTGLMLFATLHLPPRGDPNAPLHREVSPIDGEVAGAHYIKNAYDEAKTPNIVTVVLADYRSFDTLGEVIVVFAAGIACYLILRRPEEKQE